MTKPSAVVAAQVVEAVQKVALNDAVPGISPSATGAVAGAVVKEIAPTIDHLTNQEPWYQSRVTWGVIVAGAATILKPLIGELPIDEAQTADIVNALATAGQAFGLGLTLYGRWKARKPIGS